MCIYMYIAIRYVSLKSGCEMSVPHRPLWFVISLNYSEKNPQIVIKSSSRTKGSKKWEKNGRQLLSPSLRRYLSQGLCHHHWLWISFALVSWYKKSTKCVSMGQILQAGNERARGRQREIFHLANASSSIFRSHCLHFRPCHSPLPLFFFLVLIHLFPQLKPKVSPLHWQLPLFFQEMLHHHCCSHKEQLVVPCKDAFETNWHFKIKQSKTTHVSGSYVSFRFTEQSYTGVFLQIVVIADPPFLIICSLLSGLSQIFCNNHAKLVTFLFAASYFKRIFNITKRDRKKKMLGLGNLNFRIQITKVWQNCL